MISASIDRLLLVRDFERVCRGETSLAAAGQVLRLLPRDRCFYLAFEHGRICLATVRIFYTRFHTTCTHSCPASLIFSFFLQLNGLYIVNLDRGASIDSAKVVLVRPYHTSASRSPQTISCMQLTDRRIYFSWEDVRRRDFPLFEDGENKPEPSSAGSPATAEPSPEAWPWVDPEFGG